MIKLIASDLDGTLLQGGAQELTPRAISLIHQLTQKGIHFVAASGRQYNNLWWLFKPIQDEISYVAENGSLCIHQGQVLSRSTLDDDLASRILSELKHQEHFEILVSKEDACYVENNNPKFVNLVLNDTRTITKIVDDLSTLEGPILKIAICNMADGPHIIDKYLKYLQNLFGDEIKVVTSGNVWIDFITPGTNKGTALQTLMDLWHIKPSECMAFGDQYNDVEMLQLVGESYAMSNAAPGISYYSTYVTNSVEDVLEDLV